MKENLKDKKCKNCGDMFTPARPLQYVCSTNCACSYSKKKDKAKKDAEWRIEKNEIKESLFSHSDYTKILQREINKIVRIIDYGQECISCGGSGKNQAGHYHSTAAASNLRFHLDNIFSQDYRCNVHLSANIIGYNEGLERVFGVEFKNYVETSLLGLPSIKMTKGELKDKIDICRDIIKGLHSIKRTPEQRLQLRTELNKRIGIYEV